MSGIQGRRVLIEPEAMAALDAELLDGTARMRQRPASFYDTVPDDALGGWCHTRGRYGLPTAELVVWLRALIAGRSAIEVGAGYGDLAHHLGVPATDSFAQQEPHVARAYRRMGQPTIRYPATTERLEAEAAIAKHQPAVVLASWVTQWCDPYEEPPPPSGGVWFGLHEDRIVASGRTYVLIGHMRTHGRKDIMALPHEMHALPFIRSRAQDQSLNRVWVWNP